MGRASQWRQALRSELTLGSGMVITVKRASLGDFILAGKLPQPLLDYIDGLEAGKDSGPVKFSEQRELLKLIDLLVSQLVVDPKVVVPAEDGSFLDPGEDAMGTWEIPDTEKMGIFRAALTDVGLGEPTELFRGVPQAAAAPGGDTGPGEPAVREEAKRDAGAERVGAGA